MKKKKKIIIAGAIVIIVIIVAAVVAGGSSSAKVVTVAQAASGDYDGKRIQVTGNVVDNSFSTDAQGVLTFDIEDPDDANAGTVHVSYDKGVSATFGNGVSAICTGVIEGGTVTCTELVTKCPSKYESSTDALTVEQLLGYDASIVNKVVKVTGFVQEGSLNPAGKSPRLILADTQSAEEASCLNIDFDGALSDDIAEGSVLVITGSLQDNGSFAATDVALSK